MSDKRPGEVARTPSVFSRNGARYAGFFHELSVERMLNPSVIKELQKILRPENLFLSPEELHVYSYDATQQERLPWAVARPASADEVTRILLLANRERF